jgi:hypothetical protein
MADSYSETIIESPATAAYVLKTWIVVTLLALVTAAAGVRLLWFYASKPETGEPIAHQMPVACDACGRAYAAKVGRQPAKCRFCGEVRVWRAQKCYAEDCGAIFPIVRGIDEPAASDSPRCPRCGSYRVGQVQPDDITQP